jgi:hypothetical protein
MNPNDKVVCIDDKFPAGIRKLYMELPVQNNIYVIRDVRIGVNLDCKTGDISLLLVGINNPKANSKSALEFGFSSSRFKPLQEFQQSDRVPLGQPKTENTPIEAVLP